MRCSLPAMVAETVNTSRIRASPSSSTTTSSVRGATRPVSTGTGRGMKAQTTSPITASADPSQRIYRIVHSRVFSTSIMSSPSTRRRISTADTSAAAQTTMLALA